MLNRTQYNWNRLPKSAVPCDKESYVGCPSNRHSGHPFKFVYYTKNKKYIVQRFDGRNSPVVRYSINRKPCVTENIGIVDPSQVKFLFPQRLIIN